MHDPKLLKIPETFQKRVPWSIRILFTFLIGSQGTRGYNGAPDPSIVCVFDPSIVCVFSPNRFTCEGFLLLLKGCMLGPDDFEFVSGLVFLAA